MAVDLEQKLKIKADARDVKGVGTAIRDAFSPIPVKRLKTEVKALQRDLKGLTAEQVKLNKEMLAVKRGTDAYKKLKEQLEEVGDEAKSVREVMKGLSDAYPKPSKLRGRSFVGGIAQGAGLAQYIPADRGMVPRMAGAAIGGAIRRAGRIGAAPFMMPGMGGLSQGLSGIPLIGGFLGGAVSTATGAYQSAVAYSQAQLQNVYFANENRGRRRGSRVNPEYIAAREAIADAKQRRSGVTQRQSELQTEQRFLAKAHSGRAGLAYVMSRGGDRAEAVRGRMHVANILQKMAVKRGPGAHAQIVRSAANARQIEKREIRQDIKENRESLETANQEVTRALQKSRKIRKTLKGGRMSGLGSLGLGTSFGFDPTQVQGMMGQFFGARGGLFRRGMFNEAMAGQVRFGVGIQQSGQFARMGMAGGGGTGMEGGLARVLYSAFDQGLRGSQVGEYLSELVQLGKAAERKGVKIDVGAFTRMSGGLGAAGIQGVQRGRIAGQLQQAAMGLGARGVSSPIDMLLMRAAGYDPSQGAEGYAKANLRMMGGMDAGMMKSLLGLLTKGAGAGGWGQNMTRLNYIRAMGRMNVQVGPDQARKQMAWARGGFQEPETGGFFESAVGAMAPESAASRMIREARGLAPGIAKGAAGLAAQRIGVGGAVAGTVQKFESNALLAASVMKNFKGDLGNLAAMVRKATIAVKRFSEGGVMGILGSIGAAAKDLFSGGPPKGK